MISWVTVKIDVNDAVNELRETDNSASFNVNMTDFIDLPGHQIHDHRILDLVQTSMWVKQLQHDMLRDFVIDPTPGGSTTTLWTSSSLARWWRATPAWPSTTRSLHTLNPTPCTSTLPSCPSPPHRRRPAKHNTGSPCIDRRRPSTTPSPKPTKPPEPSPGLKALNTTSAPQARRQTTTHPACGAYIRSNSAMASLSLCL